MSSCCDSQQICAQCESWTLSCPSLLVQEEQNTSHLKEAVDFHLPHLLFLTVVVFGEHVVWTDWGMTLVSEVGRQVEQLRVKARKWLLPRWATGWRCDLFNAAPHRLRWRSCSDYRERRDWESSSGPAWSHHGLITDGGARQSSAGSPGWDQLSLWDVLFVNSQNNSL